MLPEHLYAIIGHPLGHSLSPALHSWAFEAVGHPGIYMAFPQEPGKVGRFFDAVRALPIRGGNITIPFKVESMKYVDRVSPMAARIGAINTFYWDGDTLCGENTDVLGFMAPLAGQTFRSALVLGAGGVSRAAIVTLQEMGVPSIAIANRTFEKAEALAGEFGIEAIPYERCEERDCDLVVNATSLGMKGRFENMSAYPACGFTRANPGTRLAYDIVYTPEKTRFLKEAAEHGWKTQSGVAMFVEQARAAFRLWAGMDMPADGAYTFVRKVLGL